jgi:hypothetical protein
VAQEERREGMASDRKRLGILALLAVSLILVSALVAVNAEAARGAPSRGGGKHGGGSTPNTATCSVTPNPAPRWSAVTISGSGYGAFNTVGITIRDSAGNAFGTWANADDQGNFSTTYNTVWLGTNTVSAAGGIGSATCTFEVV